jgi:hypothetical protein
MDFHVLIPIMGMRLRDLARILLLLLAAPLFGQQSNPAPSAVPAPDYSGMYSFLKDGEFLQINLEDGERVTGFISRYGDTDSDRGAFLDQFFKTAKLAGSDLEFTTQTVHGVWFELKATFVRGAGKNPGDESYFELKGTLTQNSLGVDNKTSSKSQTVVFKAFPRDLGSAGR